ncbi:MAG: sigma-70 family RNA polymerase sigma factor [Usitatibacter sp.]
MNRLSRFESRVLPHLDAAYNLARWLTRNDHDAQDVVQEAYARAFRYFDSLKDSDARAWLLAIVRNTGYTWLEKNRPADVVAMEDSTLAGVESVAAPPDSNPEVIVLQRAQQKLVNQSLEDLPVAFREVLVLRELEDLSYKEIAAIVGVPVGTVMSRLARGRETLRQLLEKRMRKAS